MKESESLSPWIIILIVLLCILGVILLLFLLRWEIDRHEILQKIMKMIIFEVQKTVFQFDFSSFMFYVQELCFHPENHLNIQTFIKFLDDKSH